LKILGQIENLPQQVERYLKNLARYEIQMYCKLLNKNEQEFINKTSYSYQEKMP
jgi:hypothetical protein